MDKASQDVASASTVEPRSHKRQRTEDKKENGSSSAAAEESVRNNEPVRKDDVEHASTTTIAAASDVLSTSSSPPLALFSGPLVAHAVRLTPDMDLVSSLLQVAQQAAAASSSSTAVIVLTAVGSLTSVTLRLANASAENKNGNDMRSWNEPMEVVSLVGTLSPPDDKHLHLSVADSTGKAWGGHLVRATVHTTLELVVGTISGVCFAREMDPATGYRELVVASEASSNENDHIKLGECGGVTRPPQEDRRE